MKILDEFISFLEEAEKEEAEKEEAARPKAQQRRPEMSAEVLEYARRKYPLTPGAEYAGDLSKYPKAIKERWKKAKRREWVEANKNKPGYIPGSYEYPRFPYHRVINDPPPETYEEHVKAEARRQEMEDEGPPMSERDKERKLDGRSLWQSVKEIFS